jgi:hypothetical protein
MFAVPQRLKPESLNGPFAARLKSCPDAYLSIEGNFASSSKYRQFHPRRKKQRRAEGGAPEFHSPWVGESRWMAVTRPLEIAAESSFSVGGKAESRRGLRMYGLEPAPFTNCAHLCFSGLLAGLPGKCSLFCLDLPQSADFGCTGYPV